MSLSFRSDGGLIVVTAELVGPSMSTVLRLALDTGATTTVVNQSVLVTAGYDLASAYDQVQMATGSGVESAPRIVVSELIALGHSVKGLRVLGHTLPPSVKVDGLLGLNFFCDKTLKIDFRRGRIELE